MKHKYRIVKNQNYGDKYYQVLDEDDNQHDNVFRTLGEATKAKKSLEELNKKSNTRWI